MCPRGGRHGPGKPKITALFVLFQRGLSDQQPGMGGGQHLFQNYLIGCSSDPRLPLREPVLERGEGVSRGKGGVTPRETCQAPITAQACSFAGSQAQAEAMNMHATLSCPDGGHPTFLSLGTGPFLIRSGEDVRKGDTEVEGLLTDHLSFLRVPFSVLQTLCSHRNDRKKHVKRAAYP